MTHIAAKYRHLIVFMALAIHLLSGTASALSACSDWNGRGVVVKAWYLSGETLRGGSYLNPSNVGDSNWKLVGPRGMRLTAAVVVPRPGRKGDRLPAERRHRG